MAILRKMPGKNIVHGADISDYQAKIDYKQLAAGGREFVIIKAWEKTKAAWYDRHRAGAKANGLLSSAYCFMHPMEDPVTQVENMLKAAKLQPGDLVPMIDVEPTDGMKVLGAEGSRNILKALQKIKAEIGREPIIYTNYYFFQKVDPKILQEFAKYPVCLAEYPAKGLGAGAAIPEPWKDWVFWQFSDHEPVGGLKIDADIFQGTIDQLKKYCL